MQRHHLLSSVACCIREFKCLHEKRLPHISCPTLCYIILVIQSVNKHAITGLQASCIFFMVFVGRFWMWIVPSSHLTLRVQAWSHEQALNDADVQNERQVLSPRGPEFEVKNDQILCCKQQARKCDGIMTRNKWHFHFILARRMRKKWKTVWLAGWTSVML